MKLIKYIFAVAAIASALTLSAKADLMFLGAVPFAPDNNPDTNHDALEAFLGFDPGPLVHNYEDASDLSGPVDVLPGEYFAVHYGRGNGGSSKGGSWEFFLVINGETSVTFPQFGNVAGDDPYGHGGISSSRGFGGGENAPDSGTTAALLGLGLTGLAGLRARFGRK
jgi:protein with PEP-CTERM/exosortase system signal